MINKKRRFIFVALFILLCTVFAWQNPPKIIALGEETQTEEAEDKLQHSVEDLLENLDLKALEEYFQSLNGKNGQTLKQTLFKYMNGEEISYQNFFQSIQNVFFKYILEWMPAFSCIIAISLLSCLVSSIKGGMLGNTTAETVFYVSYLGSLVPMLFVLIECFSSTIQSVKELQKQMQIIFPILLTLMSAVGGITSAQICKPAVAFLSNTILSVITSVFLPISIAIVTFSIAGNLSKELKINRFTAFFKSLNKWIIGICITVFGLFFTLQGITSASYDGVLKRTVKYAIGNGIPIIGGFLSGGFDLALAGTLLIKNSIGYLSIFMLIQALFKPILFLCSVNILLKLTSAITQPIGDERISNFLDETAGNLQYCTAGILFTAFLYLITILLMVLSTEMLI